MGYIFDKRTDAMLDRASDIIDWLVDRAIAVGVRGELAFSDDVLRQIIPREDWEFWHSSAMEGFSIEQYVSTINDSVPENEMTVDEAIERIGIKK